MFIIYFFFYSGFPKIGQGKEETGIGENERKIWNQQGRVIPKEKTRKCLIYKQYFYTRELFFSRKSVMYIVAHSTNNIQKVEVYVVAQLCCSTFKHIKT